MIRTTLLLATALLCLRESSSPAADAPISGRSTPLAPEAIFGFTNVWTLHLSFTPEQWEAMEPKQRPRSPGGPGRPRSFLQGPEGSRNGIASAFGFVFDYVHADLEFGTNKFKDVGVRYKGNGTFFSSQQSIKRSFKIDLDQFQKGQKLAEMSQLNLHNSVRDPSSMNEAVAYRLFRDGGVPAPRTAYAKVYVTVSGKYEQKYFGLYDLVEDISKEFAKERFGSSKGALLKPVTPNLFNDLGDDWKNYNQTYDPKGGLSNEDKQRIIQFCQFATKAKDNEFAAKLPTYLEIDNFARYMAITAWSTDLDGILGPGQNFYVYLHPSTHRFTFIPWDQDQPFGQFPRGTQEQRENLTIQKPWTGENRFLERVFKVDSFKKAYLAKLQEFSGTLFEPARIQRQVDELANVLRGPLEEESSEQLAALNKATIGEKVTISMGPGFAGPLEVKPIIPFVVARTKSVVEQLAGKSDGQTVSRGF